MPKATAKRPPGRPSKFNAELGRELVRLALSGDHPNRVTIARAAGIGTRTLHEWLAAGRDGRETFAGWVETFEEAEAEARGIRRARRRERREERDKARWLAFRASRADWWLRKLGPARFWSRRLQWLADSATVDALSRGLIPPDLPAALIGHVE
jgi:hypothetical protein